MARSLRWNRRGFLGGVVVAGSSFFLPKKLLARSGMSKTEVQLTGFGETGNAYEELGVTTVINAQGTMTLLGGSLIRPEVETVMA